MLLSHHPAIATITITSTGTGGTPCNTLPTHHDHVITHVYRTYACMHVTCTNIHAHRCTHTHTHEIHIHTHTHAHTPHSVSA